MIQIGDRFGKLVVLEQAEKPEKNTSTSRFWLCQCDCGKQKIVSGNCLQQGKTKSCGCLNKEKKFIDLTGLTFGKLTVIEKVDKPDNLKTRGTYWRCKCECGNEKIIYGASLRNGKVKSCGCIVKENMSVDITGQRFGKLVALYKVPSPENNSDGHTYWLCKCDCGNTKVCNAGRLRSGGVISCGCIISKGEEEIKQILLKNNINFIQQYKIPGLGNVFDYRFDFAILDNNNELISLCEFDGEQHTNKNSLLWTKEVEQSDKQKNYYCKENNIKLVRIPYTKLGKITLNMILGNSEVEE